MSPEVQIIVSLITAVPALAQGLLSALNPETRESVLAQLASAQRMLPPAGSVQAEVERVIASHPRLSIAHAFTAATVARNATLTVNERKSMIEIAEALEAGFALEEKRT